MALRARVLRSVSSLATVFALAACGAGEPELATDSADVIDPVRASVVFSPQPYESSHLPRIVALVDGAERSIDVAIYSFSDAAVLDALGRATKRGVKVRVVYESGGEHQRLEGSARASSRSGQLEALGCDVRFVNKIMHHKFMIVDGPRDDYDSAASARVVTGSANWSNGAATKYDENTLFLEGSREITLELQRDFNLLWGHSRDFVGQPFEFDAGRLVIAESRVPRDAATAAWFTSANFTVRDTTFSGNGANTVADQLVRAIGSARRSVHVASGHLRSRPVAEALVAKAKASPELDIRVYLDNQEYLGEFSNREQHEELEACLETAGASESKKRACTDKGFLFGLDVARAGVGVKYKAYAYRWDASYAKQMHHKYMVIDGSELWTGSYNLSDNAEHQTFENMLMFRGPRFAELVSAYEANFEAMWVTGEAEGRLAALRERIASGESFPIVFEPMALTWEQLEALKAEIREACPDVDSAAYRSAAAAHQVCAK